MPRENTSSGKPQPKMEIGAEGAKLVAKVLGYKSGPSNPKVGGRSGMQVKIPEIRDVSRVK